MDEKLYEARVALRRVLDVRSLLKPLKEEWLSAKQKTVFIIVGKKDSGKTLSTLFFGNKKIVASTH
jgi:polynucleotide 5'-kinase involved in rRNA processing